MNAKLGTIALMTGLFCTLSPAQDTPGGPFAGQVPVNASLKKTLNSKDAKVGQEIIATIEDAATINGTPLPKGTILLGHVVDVTRHSKETPNGSLVIVFDHEQPKKGDPMEIRSSVYQISQSENQIRGQNQDVDLAMRGSAHENSTTSSARGKADMDAYYVAGQESKAGAPVHVVSSVPGVALSAVASNTKSAIMTAHNHDVELESGMKLVVGVALK